MPHHRVGILYPLTAESHLVLTSKEMSRDYDVGLGLIKQLNDLRFHIDSDVGLWVYNYFGTERKGQ
jgi:hypothetical protein